MVVIQIRTYHPYHTICILQPDGFVDSPEMLISGPQPGNSSRYEVSMLSNGRKRAKSSQEGCDSRRFSAQFDDHFFPSGEPDSSLFASFDKNPHMIQFPTDDSAQFVADFLDEEIDKALQTRIDPCIEAKRSETPCVNTSNNTLPHTSPFESYVKQESVTSGENENDNEKVFEPQQKTASTVCVETVATLKKSIASSSRLIGTFTALKTTYLKLCKEFNFLLGKFNENERIKIELIHENNELRKLLWEAIRDREMDRKQYKTQLASLEKKKACL